MTNTIRYLFFPLLALLLAMCSSRKGELIAFREGDKYGLKYSSGKILVKPQYDDIGWEYAEGFIKVQKDGKWGLLNEKGELVTEIKYDHLDNFSKNNLAGACLNGRYGFIDTTGKEVIPFIYEKTLGFNDDSLAFVLKYGKWGIVSENGKLIVEIKYDYINSFSPNDKAVAKKNGYYGLIDKTGRETVPFVYQYIWGFEDGISRVERDGKHGFINENGEIIIPIEYDDFKYATWTEGLIGTEKNHKWGFIDRHNNIIIPFMYSEVGQFSEGLALAADALDKWGYIDRNNNKVIPFTFDDPHHCDWNTSNFSNGIAQVRLNGKSGYINKKGELVIPLKYYCIQQFCNGFAYFSIDNGQNPLDNDHEIISHGYIDTTGKEYLSEYTDFAKHIWQITPAPTEIPDSSHLLKSWDSNQKRPWTLEKLLSHALTGFRDEPQSYPDMCKLDQLCISYGMMIGGGNYSEDFIYPNTQGWNTFKEKTVYKIISSESLRQATWNWISPYYKESFQSMNPVVRKTYKDIALYLKNYINTYDRKRVEAALRNDEPGFAHNDLNGKFDPKRKISAFVDRLIIIHRAISVKDAKTWINRIADEVLSW